MKQLFDKRDRFYIIKLCFR